MVDVDKLEINKCKFIGNIVELGFEFEHQGYYKLGDERLLNHTLYDNATGAGVNIITSKFVTVIKS